jgi:rhodanese-related sulfurtransferase
MTEYRQAVRESAVILCAAVFLGLSYTFLTEKGFFGKPKAKVEPVSLGPPPSSISLPEARILFESNSALFIDARHFFDFRRGHIRSAINIPLADFDNRGEMIASLPKDKSLVVYCDAAECNSSIELSAKLYERGFGGVRIFFGGWQDWTANKLPTETSQ